MVYEKEEYLVDFPELDHSLNIIIHENRIELVLGMMNEEIWNFKEKKIINRQK